MSRLCSSRFERAARKLGWTRIAGLDEAGRGALFGPVVAAAVILNPKRRIVGLDDSKQIAPERRGQLAERRIATAEAQATAEVKAAAGELAAQMAEQVLAARIAGAKSDPLIDAAIGQMAGKLQ